MIIKGKLQTIVTTENAGYFCTVLFQMIAGYGKSKHDRISMASSFSFEWQNRNNVICNFLMGFTILQILACDLVFLRIYQLIVKKGERKKTCSIKSIFFATLTFQLFYIVLY